MPDFLFVTFVDGNRDRCQLQNFFHPLLQAPNFLGVCLFYQGLHKPGMGIQLSVRPVMFRCQEMLPSKCSKHKNKTRYFAQMISIYHKVNNHIEVTNDTGLLQSIPKENIIWVDVFGWNREEEKLIEDHFGLEIMNAEESVEIEHSARFIDFENHHQLTCTAVHTSD